MNLDLKQKHCTGYRNSAEMCNEVGYVNNSQVKSKMPEREKEREIEREYAFYEFINKDVEQRNF